MTRAHAISIQQPFSFAASGRRAVDRTPGARAARGAGWNLAAAALVVLLAGAYFASYVATVMAVGALERAEGMSAQIAAALHDAEREAARGAGAVSYREAAAAGLSEVAPRFVSTRGARAALSMNGR